MHTDYDKDVLTYHGSLSGGTALTWDGGGGRGRGERDGRGDKQQPCDCRGMGRRGSGSPGMGQNGVRSDQHSGTGRRRVMSHTQSLTTAQEGKLTLGWCGLLATQKVEALCSSHGRMAAKRLGTATLLFSCCSPPQQPSFPQAHFFQAFPGVWLSGRLGLLWSLCPCSLGCSVEAWAQLWVPHLTSLNCIFSSVRGRIITPASWGAGQGRS